MRETGWSVRSPLPGAGGGPGLVSCWGWASVKGLIVNICRVNGADYPIIRQYVPAGEGDAGRDPQSRDLALSQMLKLGAFRQKIGP